MRMMNEMTKTPVLNRQSRYSTYTIFDLDRLPASDEPRGHRKEELSGPSLQTGKSSTWVRCSAVRASSARSEDRKRARRESHAPERAFKHILHSTMMSDIEAIAFSLPEVRSFTHRKRRAHGTAGPDEDLVFLAIKTRDPHHRSPRRRPVRWTELLPGLRQPLARCRAMSTVEVIEESSRLAPGPGKRYVYNMSRDTDSGRQPSSAAVIPDAQLRLPPGLQARCSRASDARRRLAIRRRCSCV